MKSLFLILFFLTQSIFAHEPLIFILSNPRSLTTALERSFLERGDMEVFHEPFCCLHSLLHGDGYLEAEPPEIVLTSTCFLQLRDRLLASAENQVVLVKDLAYSIYPMILEDPEFLADPDVRFVFLIREPKKVIASYYRRHPDFPETVINYRALYEIFLAVNQAKGESSLVVDADELINESEKTLMSICQHLQIPYTEKMLHWQPGMQKIWQSYSSWHQDVANSKGFIKEKYEGDPFAKIPPVDVPRLVEIYEKSMPYYELLKQK